MTKLETILDDSGVITKADAIQALGGSQTLAAREMGISQSAVAQWPDQLRKHHRDRVQAALYRKALRERCKEGIAGAREVA